MASVGLRENDHRNNFKKRKEEYKEVEIDKIKGSILLLL